LSASTTTGTSQKTYGSGGRDYKSPSEYELKLGKAMDTLRKDYPKLLHSKPDFSIYSEDICAIDPSGFKLQNLSKYKASFSFLHAFLNIFYNPSQSLITYKLAYDCARKVIRVSWNVHMVPKSVGDSLRGNNSNGDGGYESADSSILGAASKEKNINRLSSAVSSFTMLSDLYVDGISVYSLDCSSGLIDEHRVERLLMNDAEVSAPEGLWERMGDMVAVGAENGMVAADGRISGGMTTSTECRGGRGEQLWNYAELEGLEESSLSNSYTGRNAFEFQRRKGQERGSTTSLFNSLLPRRTTSATTNTALYSATNSDDASSSNTNNSSSFDQKAFERKNAYRSKFGLPPITQDEFMRIQAEVQELEKNQLQKQQRSQQQNTNSDNTSTFFGGSRNFLNSILKDTCETNYDCERPEVCCDLGFKKFCCSSGMKVSNGWNTQQQGQQRMVPIPIPGVPPPPEQGGNYVDGW